VAIGRLDEEVLRAPSSIRNVIAMSNHSERGAPMPRIRNLTVAGVFAGATILGGAGLAGAAGGETEVEDPALEELQADLAPSSIEMTTFESDATDIESADDEEATDGEAPTAPTLPEQASDEARTALSNAPAFSGAEETDEAEEAGTSQEPEESDQDGNHGQEVSDTARNGEPGPDHGPAVADVARQNGQSEADAGDDAENGTDDEDIDEDADDENDEES
jgi:hypothetical protein